MQNISLCLPEDLPVGNTEHHGPSGFCLITPSKLCSMLYLLKMFLISSGVLKAINFLQLKILFSYSVFLILTVNLLKKKKSPWLGKKKNKLAFQACKWKHRMCLDQGNLAVIMVFWSTYVGPICT